MRKIRNILFDMGGVIITLDPEEAVRRFQEIGMADAPTRLDPYTQSGFVGDLELGKISAEEFREQMSRVAGREVSMEQCRYAWLGYCKEVPRRNLEALVRLRSEGYRVVLLSNTNPFMMSWVMSSDFTGGRPLSDYMDAVYVSYKCRAMKPDEAFFRKVLMSERIMPDETLFLDDGARNVAAASQLGIHTFCPKNGDDWTQEIYKYL